MPPKRRTSNAQRRAAPVTFLPPAESPRIVLGFSPPPVEPGIVVNVGIVLTRPVTVVKLLIGGAYAYLFDVVDLLVANVSALESHDGRGVAAAAFHEDKAAPLPQLHAEAGESILLRLRNRSDAPLDFRGWILARPTNDEVTGVPILPERSTRVR
jgi:hypothetical protein